MHSRPSNPSTTTFEISEQVLIWSLCNELLCDTTVESPIDVALLTKAVVKREVDPVSLSPPRFFLFFFVVVCRC
jgi:hypothetical protein